MALVRRQGETIEVPDKKPAPKKEVPKESPKADDKKPAKLSDKKSK
jgi:hypothetical protein